MYACVCAHKRVCEGVIDINSAAAVGLHMVPTGKTHSDMEGAAKFSHVGGCTHPPDISRMFIYINMCKHIA